MSHATKVEFETDYKATPIIGGDGFGWVTVNNVVAATTDYVTGDYMGASSDAMEFDSTDLADGSAGLICAAVLIDKDVSSDTGAKSCELWLFDTEPTPPANSAAWSLSDADAAKCIGVIAFSTYYASALNNVARAENLTIPFKYASDSSSIWGCLVARDTTIHSQNALTVRLAIAGINRAP